jgi:chorismate binding enzyme
MIFAGAPKVWAIRFIEKMEKSSRNWYGGAVGLIGKSQLHYTTPDMQLRDTERFCCTTLTQPSFALLRVRWRAEHRTDSAHHPHHGRHRRSESRGHAPPRQVGAFRGAEYTNRLPCYLQPYSAFATVSSYTK